MSLSVTNRRWSLAVFWFIGVLIVILFGFRANPYLQHVRGIQQLQPYPYKYIGQLILLISIHIMLVWVILRPQSYQRSWGRAFGAFIVSLGFLFWGAMGSMHAPPAWLAWYCWLISLAVGMLVLMLWSLIGKGGKD